MKRLLRTYLPSSAIAFTIVILFNSVYNLILGNNYALSGVFVLELTGLSFSYSSFQSCAITFRFSRKERTRSRSSQQSMQLS